MNDRQPPPGDETAGEDYQSPGEIPLGIYQISFADGSILKALGQRIEVTYDVGNRRVTAIYELDDEMTWILTDINWED